MDKAHSLVFKKGTSKYDFVEFWIEEVKIIEIQNPKQGILPHDMVHYVIESCFPFEGFIQLVFLGHEPGKVIEVLHGVSPKLPTDYSKLSWVTESLVEALQATLWSGKPTFADFEYGYQKACEARGIAPEAIRESWFLESLALLRKLSENWASATVEQGFELNFLPKRVQNLFRA